MPSFVQHIIIYFLLLCLIDSSGEVVTEMKALQKSPWKTFLYLYWGF